MYDELIKLVGETKTVDEYGGLDIVENEREVFATLKSITQSEFYQAQAQGLKPELKFILADFLDYQGEKIIRYKPFGAMLEAEYSVIRTYRNGNELELVCKRGVDE